MSRTSKLFTVMMQHLKVCSSFNDVQPCFQLVLVCSIMYNFNFSMHVKATEQDSEIQCRKHAGPHKTKELSQSWSDMKSKLCWNAYWQAIIGNKTYSWAGWLHQLDMLLFFCCLHFVVFSSVLCSSWESVWLWDTLRSSWFEVSTAVHCTTSRAKRMANHETKHTKHTKHIAKHFAKNDFEWFQFH